MSPEPNHHQALTNNDEIDLMKLFNKLVDNYKLLVIITLCFTAAALLYIEFATPIYKADALIQVETKKNGASSLFGDMGGLFENDASATKEIEILKSRMVLGHTVENLHLDITATPHFTPIIGSLWAKLTGNGTPTITVSQFQIPETQYNETFKLVLEDPTHGRYSLYNTQGQQLLTGQVGKLAKNASYQLLVSELTGSTKQRFDLSKQPLVEVVEKLKKILSVQERNKQTGILELSLTGPDRHENETILNDISQNYFLQNVSRNTEEAQKSLAFLEKHLPAVKNKLNQAEDELNHYRKNNDAADLSLEAQTTLQAMIKVEGQLNEIKFKESELSKRFTKEHAAYATLIDNRNTLLEEQQRLTQVIQKLPSTEREILRLRRDVEVSQQLYVSLLNKIQELNIAKASAIGNVRIIDKALTGPRPIAPKKALILALATLLGLMAGMLVVIVRASLLAGVEDPDEVEAIGLSVYATVPLTADQKTFGNEANGQGTPIKHNLLAAAKPEDLAIEALRSLRTNLHFSTLQSNNNIITITGPSPGIGKSFVSANLATVLAQSDKKVLLIDADMRKGTAHRYTACPAEPGLSEYLAGNLALEEAAKATAVNSLDFIGRGTTPPNPAELLMQPSLATLLEWAKQHYDWVIVDTPPILAVTDAAIIGSLSGATLLVGRFGQTRIKEIEVALQRFARSDVKVSGFILNAMVKKLSNTYHNNYYYYRYAEETAKS